MIMARIGRMNIKFEIIQLTFNKNSFRDVFAYQQEFIIKFNCMELCPFKLFNFEIFYHINPQKNDITNINVTKLNAIIISDRNTRTNDGRFNRRGR